MHFERNILNTQKKMNCTMRNECVKRKFYHGTTDALHIRNWILPPIFTENQREDWRKKYRDKIFFTDSLLSARKFARKACMKYGGQPIVYEIRPVGFWCGTIHTEYIADKARVIKICESGVAKGAI